MKVQDHISPIEQYVIDFIRKFRIDKELSQEDIGSIIEVSRSYIGDIENPNSRAKYNLTHINALADYFDISPQIFLPEKALIKKQNKMKGITATSPKNIRQSEKIIKKKRNISSSGSKK
ncbi:helix-turn-helix transcriptional regulator [Ginsengibacter hankyongi]|uniref:Helix-turn-helix transcriptional regulator n=1 Tax=Ginsengibacter hankyongi TaxID=2607284 RepID=A0A5J5IHJ0_9BACT|nr:helix-turn-helix transcriptional regulator [Ginsengibacter hankyongi]KAA9038736.1 helix-turn-helix transcriptional regulator [Ginsengibacter hankyongi]